MPQRHQKDDQPTTEFQSGEKNKAQNQAQNRPPKGPASKQQPNEQNLQSGNEEE